MDTQEFSDFFSLAMEQKNMERVLDRINRNLRAVKDIEDRAVISHVIVIMFYDP